LALASLGITVRRVGVDVALRSSRARMQHGYDAMILVVGARLVEGRSSILALTLISQVTPLSFTVLYVLLMSLLMV